MPLRPYRFAFVDGKQIAEVGRGIQNSKGEIGLLETMHKLILGNEYENKFCMFTRVPYLTIELHKNVSDKRRNLEKNSLN